MPSPSESRFELDGHVERVAFKKLFVGGLLPAPCGRGAVGDMSVAV